MHGQHHRCSILQRGSQPVAGTPVLLDLYRGVVPFVGLQLFGLLFVLVLGGPLVLWLPRLF